MSKYYTGNYPNSANYDPNIPVGYNKWDENDDDYCRLCGRFIDEESPYCTISDCPYREEEDLDESEEY